MDNELKPLLLKFVNREVPLSEIRSWVSDHIWDADPKVDDSIDQLAMSLVHLDDRLINEEEFHRLMVKRLGLFRFVEHNDVGSFWEAATFATVTIERFAGPAAGIPVGYAVTGESEAVTSAREFALPA